MIQINFSNNQSLCSRQTAPFILLFLLIGLIYSNTFDASWHLDDDDIIIQNPRLHLNDLQPDTLVQTFFASIDNGRYQGEQIYRPISCLTFALNWYFGKNHVTGYHIVNITIHFITASILFLTISNLFNSPNLKSTREENQYFISLLTAVLWAASPIQTQAVTYIVQRMTLLACMFYILGIYFYIKARTGTSLSIRMIFYAGCAAAFLLGLGSKENTITLPAALLLVEMIFFQNLGHKKQKIILLSGLAIVAGLIFFLGIQLFTNGNTLAFLSGYEIRSYSPLERLLTEFRVVIFYLSQIFYPDSNRLSIAHDITISTSIFSPWTTFPSILVVLFLIIFSLTQVSKRPILAFGILFYFLNHLIESTILPLEIIFEHRNYLPSLFLFFPVSAGVKQLLDHYHKKHNIIYVFIIILISCVILNVGIGTYIRNKVWKTENTLWEDAVQKAPGQARPYQYLAKAYEEAGYLKTALELYRHAMTLEDPKMRYAKRVSLNNMGNIYYRNQQYTKSMELYQKALDNFPESESVRFNLILAQLQCGSWEEASTNIEILLSQQPQNTDYLNLKGLVLLKLRQAETALIYFKKSLTVTPNHKKALTGAASALNLMKRHGQASVFLSRAKTIPPLDIATFFYLIDNSMNAGDQLTADLHTEKLLTAFDIFTIKHALATLPHNNFIFPVSQIMIADSISRTLMKHSKNLIPFEKKSVSVQATGGIQYAAYK